MRSKGSVLVAMSGGVDSSVSACLLLEQGYEVIGSHLRLLHLPGGDVDHGCCGPRAREDAEAVARIAGFPFEVVDMSDVFEETVLSDFFDEHLAGRTPNPCVRCNEHIKFGAFLERAERLGADFVATGHYVRSWRERDGSWHLGKGLDPAKDQSYMLHTLGQRELARSLFPVGGMTKAETRRLAERFGLPVADKPDSQEVCFVQGGDHAAFLEEYVPALVREGDVVGVDGRVLGRHRGAFRFTIGQRRGLGVSTGERTYVVDVDPSANRVVVGPGELLDRSGLEADRVRWVAGRPPAEGPFGAEVRIRYRGEAVPSVLNTEGELLRVRFSRPQRGVAPGQSVVVYRGDEVLGGGRILRATA
ncbi:MAG TPA: tRNA 2-thiouridine(34) synthase MnmA [Actinomycetota bacterium]|nr:tRNA 2-thiouridine(34) synthase MnmA [Actinomycetota bacterium]